MSSISLRVSDDELQLIRNYAAANSLNLSSFIRGVVLDAIEDDLSLDADRILAARDQAHREKIYSHDEAWAEIGV